MPSSSGCLLARDDAVKLCVSSAPLLERVSTWWRQIGESMLHPYDAVARSVYEGVGCLFLEFSTKRMSRLAGDKLVPTEDAVAIRSGWVAAMCRFVWEKADLLRARAKVLTLENFRASVYPLVFSAKAVATGMVDDMEMLTGNRGKSLPALHRRSNAENILGISDVVSHLLPYLLVLDPALVYEVSVNLLSLADVPGGKPEWASAPITALLTLWDRHESIVRETQCRAREYRPRSREESSAFRSSLTGVSFQTTSFDGEKPESGSGSHARSSLHLPDCSVCGSFCEGKHQKGPETAAKHEHSLTV